VSPVRPHPPLPFNDDLAMPVVGVRPGGAAGCLPLLCVPHMRIHFIALTHYTTLLLSRRKRERLIESGSQHHSGTQSLKN
jgi:hypothetical protein